MMRLREHILCALAAIALAPVPLCAQMTDAQISLEDRQMELVVEQRIRSFTDELDNLSALAQNAPVDVYPDLVKKYNSSKLRWDTYYQSYQGFIADHESLMQAVAEYGIVNEDFLAVVEEMKAKMEAHSAFDEAVKFIGSQDSLYVAMYKRANALSATQKLAGELEKLKGKEQLVFADIQEEYDAAKAAVELLPELKGEMEELDDSYIALKSVSAKIQEAAFKPLVQRVKDYLIGIAAVAVVLMFISMLQGRLKAAKQMKENLKKMKDSLGGGKDELPTI